VFSLAVSGEAKLSPRGDVFFSARLVADGTARPYLEKTCPSNPTPFCESLVKPSLSSGDILWSDTSYLNRYKDAVAKVRDASQLVHGTMATKRKRRADRQRASHRRAARLVRLLRHVVP
jgi:hypothetical protein